MGRLLDKEEFLDTFGLNLSRRIEQEKTRHSNEETEEYTDEEMKILLEFESFIRESTLDEQSEFKRRLRDLCERSLKKKKRKDDE